MTDFAGLLTRLREADVRFVLIGGFAATIQVVTLEQLIHLKRAAGRARDLAAVAELEALLEEQRGTSGAGK